MAKKPKRQREHFEIGDVLPIADLDLQHIEEPEEPSTPIRAARSKGKREPTTKKLRSRPQGRKNYSVGIPELIEFVLSQDKFFTFVEPYKLPPGKRGPKREYSDFMVWLWHLLYEEFDSVHDLEAYFRHPWTWNHIAAFLTEAWPDNLERQVPVARPMSRSQFCRHRSKLKELFPEAMDRARVAFTEMAVEQALSMGYFPNRGGSLANPHPLSIASGDGTVIQAATDAIEGDMVIDANGEAQQARYDAEALLNWKDERKGPNPAYTFSHLQAANPEAEQERVVLTFGRSDAFGEARELERQAAALKALMPWWRTYSYDMAVQGASINRLYEIGIYPAIKVPRDKKARPASALIETRLVVGHSAREHTVQVYGLDGVVGMKVIAGHDEYFVPLVPKALRQPRVGNVQGFYKIPDQAVIPRDLRGIEIMVRLNGTTDDGRHRPQYIRWINEHTEKGRAILGMREGTESEHSTIKKMLPWDRARSFGEFHVTFDLLGYFLGRNLKAAMAHRRRTGINPLHSGPPPEVQLASAA